MEPPEPAGRRCCLTPVAVISTPWLPSRSSGSGGGGARGGWVRSWSSTGPSADTDFRQPTDALAAAAGLRGGANGRDCLLGPINWQTLVREFERKRACRLSGSPVPTADDAASLEIGDKQGSRRDGRPPCVRAGAGLRRSVRIAPMGESFANTLCATRAGAWAPMIASTRVLRLASGGGSLIGRSRDAAGLSS